MKSRPDPKRSYNHQRAMIWGIFGLCLLLLLTGCNESIAPPSADGISLPKSPSTSIAAASTPTNTAPEQTLTTDDRYEQICAEAIDHESLNEPAVGLLWLSKDAKILFRHDLFDSIAQTADLAEVLLCSDTEFIRETVCQYPDVPDQHLKRIVKTFALVQRETGQVLRKGVFQVAPPEACPEGITPDNWSSSGYKFYDVPDHQEQLSWLTANWSRALVAEILSSETSSQPSAKVIPPLRPQPRPTSEQVERISDTICRWASDMEPEGSPAAGGIWVHGEPAEELFASLPEQIRAGSLLEAQTLLCAEVNYQGVKACYYENPGINDPVSELFLGKDLPFEAVQKKISYNLTLVDLDEERVTSRLIIPGSDPPSACPEKITVLWVNRPALTRSSFVVSLDDQEKLDGKPPLLEAVVTQLQEVWGGSREAPQARYEFTRYGYLDGVAVNDLALAQDGTIWVAAENGIFHFSPIDDIETWEYFNQDDGTLPVKSARAVFPAEEGVWATSTTGQNGLIFYDGLTWRIMAGYMIAKTLVVDGEGRLWSDKGIWNGEQFIWPEEITGLFKYKISNLQGDRGSVWVSDNSTLVRFDDERPVVSIKGPNWAAVQVWSFAPNGTILVGGGWGLALGSTEEFFRIPEVYGNVQEIALDDETIWVTTSDNGLFHFNGQTWTHIDWLDGFPMDGANEILIDPQGVVWAGGKEGLVSVRVVAR